jgi:cell division protease FtsH
LLAKAIASEAGAKFYAQSASAFVEMFAGLGAARIRKLFEEARKNAPAIIFIDELDAVGSQRTGHGFTREQDQTLNQLLVELDGFESREQIVVMGASNRLQDLDVALLRPGRFDRQVLVAAPDLAGREAILRVHTRGKPLGEDVDLMSVARQTAGLTGAELENIANEAAIFAGRSGQKELLQADFENAMERVVAGLQQRKVMTEKERRIVAYHEAGHALSRRLLGLDPPEILSIVPRGPALGFVGHAPQEDSYLKSRDELVDEVVTLLGGRAAEEEVFGESYSGAVDDLARVHAVCRQMAAEFGMGVALDHDGPPPIALPTDDYAVSDATRRDVDLAAMSLAREAYRRSRALLAANRECLDDLATSALERETLSREELDEIFAAHELRPLSQTRGSAAALVALTRDKRE